MFYIFQSCVSTVMSYFKIKEISEGVSVERYKQKKALERKINVWQRLVKQISQGTLYEQAQTFLNHLNVQIVLWRRPRKPVSKKNSPPDGKRACAVSYFFYLLHINNNKIHVWKNLFMFANKRLSVVAPAAISLGRREQLPPWKNNYGGKYIFLPLLIQSQFESNFSQK